MKKELPELKITTESIGNRLSKFRKRLGLTQNDLAEKIGIKRALVSEYEIGRLHLNDEMIIRFAIALNISSDEILGLLERNLSTAENDLKITKRLKKIEKLPPTQKKALLNTIDTYLKAYSIDAEK